MRHASSSVPFRVLCANKYPLVPLYVTTLIRRTVDLRHEQLGSAPAPPMRMLSRL
jgi:hypothetical protein